MPAADKSELPTETRVFLNLPYGARHDRLLIALTAGLTAVGCNPQLTFQVKDGGQGRMRRIFDLLKSCQYSIHDLSAVGLPVRFNMPFELGLACALKEHTGKHDFLVLERVPHRLDMTLSDLKGVDPKIHGGSSRRAISAILEWFERPGGNPTLREVLPLARYMGRIRPLLCKEHGRDNLFGRQVYGDLVSLGRIEALRLEILSG
jgi:hypothetical protein